MGGKDGGVGVGMGGCWGGYGAGGRGEGED